MYKLIIWLCLGMDVVFGKTVDPFVGHVAKKASLPLTKKYQYLGYIKGPKLHRGFIRAAGGEVQGLNFGRNPGVGQVTLLNKQQICITKQKQQWCLDKSLQAKLWHLGQG